jgi:hypothetical protein
MGAVLVVGITGCQVAAIVLLRRAAPPTYQVHMTTGDSPRTVMLAEQIRAEGGRHHLEVKFTLREYGTLDALERRGQTTGREEALSSRWLGTEGG